MSDVGWHFFDQIARNEDNLLSVRFRHAKSVKDVGIAAR
jgi:hypothetical protein